MANPIHTDLPQPQQMQPGILPSGQNAGSRNHLTSATEEEKEALKQGEMHKPNEESSLDRVDRGGGQHSAFEVDTERENTNVLSVSKGNQKL